MSFISHAEGKQLASWRKKERMAVQGGRARWLASKPPVTEVRQPARPPVKHERGRQFGMGLGERHPVYRSPVSIEDLCWWEEEANREQEREIDRRFAEYQAQERLSNGLDPY